MEVGIMEACGQASFLIMGTSFVVGSMSTIFILVLLDMYRSRNAATKGE